MFDSDTGDAQALEAKLLRGMSQMHSMKAIRSMRDVIVSASSNELRSRTDLFTCIILEAQRDMPA